MNIHSVRDIIHQRQAEQFNLSS